MAVYDRFENDSYGHKFEEGIMILNVALHCIKSQDMSMNIFIARIFEFLYSVTHAMPRLVLLDYNQLLWCDLSIDC